MTTAHLYGSIISVAALTRMGLRLVRLRLVMKLSIVAVAVPVVGVMRVVATLMVVGVVILQNVHGIVARLVVVENPRGFLSMDMSGCLLA